MNETVKATTHHWSDAVDSALLILLLTAGAYAVAFEYQAGYLLHFGVPETLCEVNLRELIIGGAAVLVLATSLLFLTNAMLSVLPKAWPPVVQRRAAFLTFFLVLAINAAAYGQVAGSGSLLLVGIPLVLLLGELLMPLVTHRGLPTYAAKLEASVRADISRTTATDKTVQTLVSAFTPVVAAVILFIVVAAFLAQGLGRRAASEQTKFLVSDDYYTPCAVVAALSEGLLCVSFDARTHATLGVYRFIKPAGASVTLREVGPLKAAVAQHTQT